eukprot:122280_1
MLKYAFGLAGRRPKPNLSDGTTSFEGNPTDHCTLSVALSPKYVSMSQSDQTLTTNTLITETKSNFKHCDRSPFEKAAASATPATSATSSRRSVCPSRTSHRRSFGSTTCSRTIPTIHAFGETTGSATDSQTDRDTPSSEVFRSSSAGSCASMGPYLKSMHGQSSANIPKVRRNSVSEPPHGVRPFPGACVDLINTYKRINSVYYSEKRTISKQLNRGRDPPKHRKMVLDGKSCDFTVVPG